MTIGMKFDTDKLSYSLLPRAALAWTTAVLTYGAIKYARGNWEHVEQWDERYYDALIRHLEAWRAGEYFDEETSLPHLAHAACCVVFLLGKQHPTLDELPKRLAYALSVARKIRSSREARPEGSAPAA